MVLWFWVGFWARHLPSFSTWCPIEVTYVKCGPGSRADRDRLEVGKPKTCSGGRNKWTENQNVIPTVKAGIDQSWLFSHAVSNVNDWSVHIVIVSSSPAVAICSNYIMSARNCWKFPYRGLARGLLVPHKRYKWGHAGVCSFCRSKLEVQLSHRHHSGLPLGSNIEGKYRKYHFFNPPKPHQARDLNHSKLQNHFESLQI